MLGINPILSSEKFHLQAPFEQMKFPQVFSEIFQQINLVLNILNYGGTWPKLSRSETDYG